MRETLTMIIAGSELPCVQIRSVWSSEALSQHCLLRLQLTLLTGLSWPENTQEWFRISLEMQCAVATFTFMVVLRELGKREDQEITLTYWSPQLWCSYLCRPLVEAVILQHLKHLANLSLPVNVYLTVQDYWIFDGMYL